MPDSSDPGLQMRGISKRFGNVVALDDARLEVRAGTVHALLGENGAGKTTLMRIAYGMLRPDAGSVTIGGRVGRLRSPAEAMAAGLGMVQQHFALVSVMSVADNVALGMPGRYNARAAADRVRALATETGLALDPNAVAGTLPVETQQRLEIVKALARQARLLILDEPTAVLAPSAAAELLRWLRRFAGRGGSAVLITHKLGEALGISDDITVLRRGRTVLESRASVVTESELASAMLNDRDWEHRSAVVGGRSSVSDRQTAVVGGRSSESAPPGERIGAPVILAEAIALVDGRGVTKIVDASFEVRSGEIVGIAAVEGEGQHELLRALAGRLSVAAGRLVRPERVGFVPEDRRRDALVAGFPLFENVALRDAGVRRGLMAWGRERAATRELLREYDVRASGEAVPAATLSGGNQQRLVLARELAGRPEAIVVENPTRGLDIRATRAIHDRLRTARDGGAAVVMYASDVDEVVALADRVLVLARRTVREVPVDREQVGRAMLGVGD